MGEPEGPNVKDLSQAASSPGSAVQSSADQPPPPPANEPIVRSTHSTQSAPATILEVRRILYEHLGIACGLECEVLERVDAGRADAP